MWKALRLRQLHKLMAVQGEQVTIFDWKVPGPQFRFLWIIFKYSYMETYLKLVVSGWIWTSVDSNVYKVRIFVYAHKKKGRRITELLNKVINR